MFHASVYPELMTPRIFQTRRRRSNKASRQPELTNSKASLSSGFLDLATSWGRPGPASCPTTLAVRKQQSGRAERLQAHLVKEGAFPREGKGSVGWASVSTATAEAALCPFMSSHPGQRTRWEHGQAHLSPAQQEMPGLWGEGEDGGSAVEGKGSKAKGWLRPQLCSYQLHISASVFSPEKWAHATHCRELLGVFCAQVNKQEPSFGTLPWAGTGLLYSAHSNRLWSALLPSYSTDEETEVQKGAMPCPPSHTEIWS